jgi:hypothetical protein
VNKTRDEIGVEVLRAINSGNSCLNLRAVCRDYDEDELHIALDYVPPIQGACIAVVMEAIGRLRHKQVKEQFEDLKREIKKPTWFDSWTFRFVVISAIIAVLDLCRPLLFPEPSRPPTSQQSVAAPLLPPPVVPPATSLTKSAGQDKLAQKPLLKGTNSVVVPASPQK